MGKLLRFRGQTINGWKIDRLTAELEATNNHLVAAETWAEERGIYSRASGVTLARHLERAWDKAEATATQLRAGLEGHVGWLRAKAEMARNERDAQTDMARVHHCDGEAKAWGAAAAHAEQVLKDG